MDTGELERIARNLAETAETMVVTLDNLNNRDERFSEEDMIEFRKSLNNELNIIYDLVDNLKSTDIGHGD